MSATPCFHCGLPVPADGDYSVVIAGVPQPMCCPGCEAVAQTIIEMGMERFYEHRGPITPGQSPAAQLIPAELQRESPWDNPATAAACSVNVAEHQHETHLMVSGITCAACAWLIESRLDRLPGITQCRINSSSHLAQVVWDENTTGLGDIIRAIQSIGYDAEPWSAERQQAALKTEHKQALMRLGVAGIGAMQVMMYAASLYLGAWEGIEPAHVQFLRWVSCIVTTPVLFYSGSPFLVGAWRSLRQRSLTMDVPVAIALMFAYCASIGSIVTGGPEVYFDSVTMFVFFLLTGRYLEMRARHSSEQARLRLSQRATLTARQQQADGSLRIVLAAHLQPGDQVKVLAGDTVPGDGIILDGHTAINESMLTGESLPLPRGPGDGVVGGTINVEQPVTVEITQTGKDSTLSALQNMLRRAQSERPLVARLADRVASFFVAAVLIVATAVYLFWQQRAPDDAFWIMLSVLVVTCPCALSLATPTALAAALAGYSRRGFIVTRPDALEQLPTITDAVFDKTGTLTTGRYQCARIVVLAGQLTEDSAYALACALERDSEHPLAAAFSGAPHSDVHAVKVVAGAGMEGTFNGERLRLGTPAFAADFATSNNTPELTPPAPGQWLLLANATTALAWFEVIDSVRAGAQALVDHLQAQSIRTHILSGDPSGAAQTLGQNLGVDAVRDHASAADKVAYIQALQTSGRRVLMVGDGLNDAPVLAAADVSVAVANASDLAQLAADTMLLNPDLTALQRVITGTERTRRIIRQNLTWAILYNLLALPLAAAGMIPPWASALGMSASSLLVVLNALRAGDR